ncbi:MAG: flagellar hook-basal body complex protein [Eubacterium sp.]|jgi:flagellar hook protein FlgE|nr:flagellar hook-basal body complex protein [Eubacterium sp.]
MMKSLYSGVTGLKNHNTRMDVIGNNISNVNTTAYKASAVTFKDVYYQTKQQSSAGDNTTGGVNPNQVGYGVSMGTINQIMGQSGFTYSDSGTDCALEGEGFFQVMDPAGNIFYTRNGNFTVDNVGNLVDPKGNIVLGVMGDPTGVDASTQRITLLIPDVQDSQASATKTVAGGYDVTVQASEIGENGNISLTISQGDSFATLSGSNLKITMDLTRDYANQQEFQEAVNDAIIAGGVNMPEGVLPLSIQFDSMPAETAPSIASNIMNFKIKPLDPEEEDIDLYLKFDATVPGEYANVFTVSVKTSSTATAVSAKWQDDALTITVPGKKEYAEDEEMPEISIEAIQNAIYRAAGVPNLNADDPESEYDPDLDNIALGNPQKVLMVTEVERMEDGTYEEGGIGVEGFEFYQAIGTNTKKVGLANGEDSFYAKAVQDMATLRLENGRVQATQTVDDLDTLYIDNDGVIYGEHPVHGTLLLGRIDLATFENPIGLNQAGNSYWKESLASGPPEVKEPGSYGAALVVSGALEMSNVDLSQEFSDMIITQRGFQANSRIITVSDTMLEELINLKR